MKYELNTAEWDKGMNQLEYLINQINPYISLEPLLESLALTSLLVMAYTYFIGINTVSDWPIFSGMCWGAFCASVMVFFISTVFWIWI